MANLKPPRMPPKRQIDLRFALAVSILLGVFAAGIFWIFGAFQREPDLGETEEIVAYDVQWLATRVQWREIGGSFELHTAMLPAWSNRNWSSPEINELDLIGALCGALLVALPPAPNENVSRRDVRTLRLNFWQLDEGARITTLWFERPMEIPILEGRCPENYAAPFVSALNGSSEENQ